MLRREKFDPERDYLANKSFKAGGVDYNSGDSFNKESVNTRRLRQMYEARYLKMGPEKAPETLTPIKPTMPNFSSLSEEGLRAWLKTNGIIPNPRTKIENLVKRAEERWKELNNGEPDSNGAGEADRSGVRRTVGGRNSEATRHNGSRRSRRSH